LPRFLPAVQPIICFSRFVSSRVHPQRGQRGLEAEWSSALVMVSFSPQSSQILGIANLFRFRRDCSAFCCFFARHFFIQSCPLVVFRVFGRR
jgi:hypothetical protein